MQNEDSALTTQTPKSRTALAFLTHNQREAVLLICLVAILFLGVESWRKPALIGDPPPSDVFRSDEIQDRLNPNTADAASLSAIPNLGEKRAAMIVDYREHFLQTHPGQTPFSSADDLLRIKGFGVATIGSLKPYLTFTQQRSNPPPASGFSPK